MGNCGAREKFPKYQVPKGLWVVYLPKKAVADKLKDEAKMKISKAEAAVQYDNFMGWAEKELGKIRKSRSEKSPDVLGSFRDFHHNQMEASVSLPTRCRARVSPCAAAAPNQRQSELTNTGAG